MSICHNRKNIRQCTFQIFLLLPNSRKIEYLAFKKNNIGVVVSYLCVSLLQESLLAATLTSPMSP